MLRYEFLYRYLDDRFRSCENFPYPWWVLFRPPSEAIAVSIVLTKKNKTDNSGSTHKVRGAVLNRPVHAGQKLELVLIVRVLLHTAERSPGCTCDRQLRVTERISYTLEQSCYCGSYSARERLHRSPLLSIHRLFCISGRIQGRRNLPDSTRNMFHQISMLWACEWGKKLLYDRCKDSLTWYLSGSLPEY